MLGIGLSAQLESLHKEPVSVQGRWQGVTCSNGIQPNPEGVTNHLAPGGGSPGPGWVRIRSRPGHRTGTGFRPGPGRVEARSRRGLGRLPFGPLHLSQTVLEPSGAPKKGEAGGVRVLNGCPRENCTRSWGTAGLQSSNPSPLGVRGTLKTVAGHPPYLGEGGGGGGQKATGFGETFADHHPPVAAPPDPTQVSVWGGLGCRPSIPFVGVTGTDSRDGQCGIGEGGGARP